MTTSRIDIRGPTMQQSGFHHANFLASKIRNELRESQIQMLTLSQNQKIEEQTEEAHFFKNNHQQIEHNANIVMQQKL